MQLDYALALVTATSTIPGRSPISRLRIMEISPLAGLAMMRSRRFKGLTSSTPSLLAQTVIEQRLVPVRRTGFRVIFQIGRPPVSWYAAWICEARSVVANPYAGYQDIKSYRLIFLQWSGLNVKK
jgi:hypothetical protein